MASGRGRAYTKPALETIPFFSLTENMRIATAGGDASQAQWYNKDWLLRVGNGNEQTVINPDDNIRQDFIKLPEQLCLPNQSTESLINFTFPDLRELHSESDITWATYISTVRYFPY